MYDTDELLAAGGPLDALATRLAKLCGPSADRDDLSQTAKLAVWEWSQTQPDPTRVDAAAAIAVAKVAAGRVVRGSRAVEGWPVDDDGDRVDFPVPDAALAPGLPARLANFRARLAAALTADELACLEEVYCWGRGDPAAPIGWDRVARRLRMTVDEAVGLAVRARAKAAARVPAAVVENLRDALKAPV